MNEAVIPDQRIIDGYSAFPVPGAVQCFFDDTLQKAGRISIPTLILHGEEDKLDTPDTAQLLYNALACRKQLEIILDNGHIGHVDRKKERVMLLTAEWVLKNIRTKILITQETLY